MKIINNTNEFNSRLEILKSHFYQTIEDSKFQWSNFNAILMLKIRRNWTTESSNSNYQINSESVKNFFPILQIVDSFPHWRLSISAFISDKVLNEFTISPTHEEWHHSHVSYRHKIQNDYPYLQLTLEDDLRLLKNSLRENDQIFFLKERNTSNYFIFATKKDLFSDDSIIISDPNKSTSDTTQFELSELQQVKTIRKETLRKLADSFDNLNKYTTYFAAIRTKPFLLLAGISGTGKSRLVRELAYMSCPKLGKLQEDPTTPGNFCMIEVKPNWHDSSELLGYTSGIKNTYIITPFVKFLVKAMRYPEVPFFVCLDEMNLAPVEQYFAEYLSVLETRKIESDSIISGSLINKDVFTNHQAVIFESLGLKSLERTDMQEEIIQIAAIENELKEFGLRLPQNVIVVGTVNMDDTTHQFSRKVIDRAMTIEMNELNFNNMFDDKEKLNYFDEPLDAHLFISDSVSANHALELIDEDAEQLKAQTIEIMQALDEKLKDTPFRVAYRVQNELVLYFRNLRLINPQTPFDELFPSAVDSMLKIKVLPRIEGDEDMVKKPLKALDVWTTESGYTGSNTKIKEMLIRLDHAHYTSYWP